MDLNQTYYYKEWRERKPDRKLQMLKFCLKKLLLLKNLTSSGKWALGILLYELAGELARSSFLIVKKSEIKHVGQNNFINHICINEEQK